MPTSECEVITGTSLSSSIIRGLSSSAICHEALRDDEQDKRYKKDKTGDQLLEGRNPAQHEGSKQGRKDNPHLGNVKRSYYAAKY